MSTQDALRLLADVAVRQGTADPEWDRDRLGLTIIDTLNVHIGSVAHMPERELQSLACAYATREARGA